MEQGDAATAATDQIYIAFDVKVVEAPEQVYPPTLGNTGKELQATVAEQESKTARGRANFGATSKKSVLHDEIKTTKTMQQIILILDFKKPCFIISLELSFFVFILLKI